MTPSLDTYMATLRAVDAGFESTHDGCWLNNTSEIAASLHMTRQRVTPILHTLAKDGYIFSIDQPNGSVTWHLYDAAVKLLRGEREIVVLHHDGMFGRPSRPHEFISD